MTHDTGKRPRSSDSESGGPKNHDAVEPTATTERFVVDRIEGDRAILFDSRNGAHELLVSALPAGTAAEGAVLLVPQTAAGTFEWRLGARDRTDESRRKAEASARVERLRRGDTGGDVTL